MKKRKGRRILTPEFISFCAEPDDLHGNVHARFDSRLWKSINKQN
jgi:hypothetical protein